MQERRRCVNPLPVDDTVAKARMFHLAQGVLVGLADGLPKRFSANSPTLHRGSFALARRRRLRTRAHRRPSTVQRLQRREDERRGQRRAPAHHAPPKETTHLIRTHERKVTRPPLHNPVCSARLEPTNGRIRCRRGYGGPRGYAVSAWQFGLRALRQPEGRQMTHPNHRTEVA